MKYKIVYTPSSFRDIKKLDAVAKKKIKSKIELYSINPRKYAKKPKSSESGTYRWRAGNYRIIFDIDKETIVILRVGHRKEVYK